jgi:hypothetical protein
VFCKNGPNDKIENSESGIFSRYLSTEEPRKIKYFRDLIKGSVRPRKIPEV